MASPFSDEGIVLRRRAYGDADRILVILTRDHGKLSVMARGLRRARARNAAGMDLLARSQLQLIPGRSMAVLAQARPIGPSPGPPDPVRLACAGVLAELVDATVEEGHPEPRVYDILAEASARIGSAEADPRLWLALAAFALAAAGGYQPELSVCVACGRELENREGRFVSALGGVVQGDCQAGAAALPCSAATLRVLRRMALADERTVLRLRWNAVLKDEVEAILIAHLEHHLDRPIKAARVLVELRP
ncbi:MAG: DNA repair protein RecO [Candidatus Dormibacteria bacterium]